PAVKPDNPMPQAHRSDQAWERFALQRGQARSPQGHLTTRSTAAMPKTSLRMSRDDRHNAQTLTWRSLRSRQIV
ncbi:hypothetical protein, partial [Pseudomonas asplenii]|uniref:hypothetical protein n=1 Tax=Pseudomonas asplenii TaxID=53407 RepID=UPI001E56CD43